MWIREQDTHPIQRFVLAIRPGEAISISPKAPEKWTHQDYAICMALLPVFPRLNPPVAQHVGVLPYTLACATIFPTILSDAEPVWGWVVLDPGFREYIINCMVDEGYTGGRWYYMHLHGVNEK